MNIKKKMKLHRHDQNGKPRKMKNGLAYLIEIERKFNL
jgi:hypothetical protein